MHNYYHFIHVTSRYYIFSALCRTEDEVFFPGEFTQRCSCLQDGWHKVPSNLETYPLCGTERTAIPIYQVRHVAHSWQTSGIKPHEGQTSYTFMPNPKYGKEYDEEEKTSYKRNRLHKIEHDERVLEGNLSWWEVDTYSWYKSDDVRGKSIGSTAASLYCNNIYLSHFMSNPRESHYGDCGFVVNFKDLLKSYKQSRTDVVNIRDRELFLRVGGTLRYYCEICYVVIVCTKHDQELKHYPSLYTCSDIFDHNGLLLPSGKIKPRLFETNETIHFKIHKKHVIKCVPKQQHSCYEAPAFAFYYPETSTTSSLKCLKGEVKEVYTRHKCTKRCERKREKLHVLDSCTDD